MQDQVTDLEKAIYNKHLATSRSQKNRPFKIKRNFEDIVGTNKHKFLKRIAIFFKKHSDIDLNTFFEAPYKLYPDVAYFDLEYFSSMRAVRSYTMYKKIKLLKNPDEQIKEIEKSLRFIANFCIQQRIQFHNYIRHSTGDMCTWFKHYKENKINLYSLFEFTDVLSTATRSSEDLQQFFANDFLSHFQTLYSSYNNSFEAKPYVKKAFRVLSNFVNSQLSNVKNPV